MAEKSSVDSSSSLTSPPADSCFNKSMLISSTDTLSETIMENLPNGSVCFLTTNSTVTMDQKTGNFTGTPLKSPSLTYARWAQIQSKKSKQTFRETGKSSKSGSIIISVKSMMEVLSHTAEAGKNDFCEKFQELTSSSIEGSNVWSSALTLLEDSFGESEELTGKERDEIIDKLRLMYDYDPRRFTETLLTIIEEESNAWKSDLSNDLAEDNQQQPPPPPPRVTFSHDDEDSTQYRSLQLAGNSSKEGETCEQQEQSPTIFINALDVTESYSVDSLDAAPSPRSIGRVNATYKKTPKIVIIPETPNAREGALESPRDFNDDDDYLSAESEVEDGSEKDTIIGEETDNKSKDQTINLNKVALQHKEWSETYDKVYRYKQKPIGSPLSTKNTNGSRKIPKYNANLEKRWLRELSRKRQQCLDTLNLLLEHVVAKPQEPSSTETSLCLCDRCKRQAKFYNTMMVCSDYHTSAIDARDFARKSIKTTEKKSRRSVSKSPDKSTRSENPSDPQEVRGPTGKTVSRKSLGKKIKSPVSRYVSPSRRSIIVKPLKSPIRGGYVVKSSLRLSPRTRRNKGSPKIDRASIRPVSQLRMIFSPRSKIPGSAELKQIPLPKQLEPTTCASKFSAKLTTPGIRKSPTNKLGFAGTSSRKAQFKHVKSPVREYIKGRNNPRNERDRLDDGFIF